MYTSRTPLLLQNKNSGRWNNKHVNITYPLFMILTWNPVELWHNMSSISHSKNTETVRGKYGLHLVAIHYTVAF